MKGIVELRSVPDDSGEGYAKDSRKKRLEIFGLLATVVLTLLVVLSGSSARAEDIPVDFLGNVAAWGNNASGQLGDATNTRSNKAVGVVNVDGVKTVAGGCDHSLALKSDGTVWAWGDNDFGQLGDGTNTDSNKPVQVKNLSGVKTIASGCNHSLALKEDGTVRAWGVNYFGQLGDGTNTDSNTPVSVKTYSGGTFSGVRAISGGSFHNLALKEDGTVFAWGENWVGQLGDGTNTNRKTPVQVKNLSGVKAIAGGAGHSLALKTDGSVRAWGFNGYGQLGNGTNTDSNTPVSAKTRSGAPLGGIKAIAAGYRHSLALRTDGSVRAWGHNSSGQLGDGTNTSSNTPVSVKTRSGALLGEVKAVAGGGEHSLALKTDGTVRSWGENLYGQVGNGTNTNSNTPVSVKTRAGDNLSGIQAIAGGGQHSLAAVKQ